MKQILFCVGYAKRSVTVLIKKIKHTFVTNLIFRYCVDWRCYDETHTLTSLMIGSGYKQFPSNLANLFSYRDQYESFE